MAIAADERFSQFVAPAALATGLTDETVEMIWDYVRPDDIDYEDTPPRRTFGVVVPEI